MVSRIAALVLVASLLALAPAAAQTGAAAQPGPPGPSALLKQGIAHFDKAFYEWLPRNRHAEAGVEFQQAIVAFEAELKANPASADAHRYLARTFAARGDARKAAAHWDGVALLEPFNVDACILAALAFLDAKDPGEARERLVGAKDRTLDARVLARLDEYIAKVDALAR